MSKIIIATAFFAALSATSLAQVVECKIVPIQPSFECHENIIVKVQLRNRSHDTVCVDNIAHSFGGRPMRIYINGNEFQYDGPSDHVLSGVYVNPFSEYCFYMAVGYSLPNHMAIYRTEPGTHELLYESDIFVVKNYRRTKEKVGRLSGAVKYEVYSSPQSALIARTLSEKSIMNGQMIDIQERYRLLNDLIDEHGIEAVNGVAEYMIRSSGRRNGAQSDLVHAKAAKLTKRVTTGTPGACVCRWDE